MNPRVDYRAIGTAQRLAKHEREFDLDARNDEAAVRQFGAVLKKHVIEQRAIIGLVDLRGILHRLGGESDLVPLEPVSLGDLDRHPRALDRVSVVDRDARETDRELTNL